MSDLGLHCLPKSDKKDARLIWIKLSSFCEDYGNASCNLHECNHFIESLKLGIEKVHEVKLLNWHFKIYDHSKFYAQMS